MSTQPAGATVEQRYPGPTQDEARRLAGPRVRAFQAAGWTVADEAWLSATGIPGAGGMLVVTYVASRDTEVPGLQAAPETAVPATAEPPASFRPSTVTIRIAIILVILVIVMILFAWFVDQLVQQGGPGGVGVVAGSVLA